MIRVTRIFFLLVVMAMVTGCAGISTSSADQTPVPGGASGLPPTTIATESPTPTEVPSPTAVPEVKVWIADYIPAALKTDLTKLPAGYSLVTSRDEADVVFSVIKDETAKPISQWTFVLAAPFPTIKDELKSDELKTVFAGNQEEHFNPQKLLMSPETKAILETLWGRAGSSVVTTVPEAEMLDAAWSENTTWAIVPFEQLHPRWKVIRVGGISPMERGLANKPYALTVNFGFTAKEEGIDIVPLQALETTLGNRDESKLTTVMLTGVTALARTTAMTMDTKGVEYPYRDIGDWMRYPDITHVSNEVSFDEQCPPPRPVRVDMLFCSQVEYIKLFTDLDIDVIELTGNHLVDYGVDALDYTLATYDEKKIPYYGGGKNLEDAKKAVHFEHNGNKVAFIGCNVPGPVYDFAEENRAGAAPCGDFDWVLESIAKAKNDGYMPIVTLQHYETDLFMPISIVQRDMEMLADAGAVIVSGSQAHFPHGFTFRGDSFVHYGLGNLFFDQMFSYNQYEFLDQHYFYDARYLGVEIKTARLEEWARPRPMTEDERKMILEEVFKVSNWTYGGKVENP